MANAPRLFPWVQALRAIAAVSVAFVHTANDAVTAGSDPAGVIESVVRAMPWVAGVDIFFVISGFVIIHASGSLFAQPGGWARFLRRRLTRIVPLYWALTALFLLTLVLRPMAVRGDIGGAGYILASFLFLPWPRPDGLMEPALGLGWTLNYEMFFYLVLTPFLLLRRGRAVLASGLALCVLVAAGRYAGFGPQLAFWSDPIILEFVIGMGLALAVDAGLRLPGWLRLILIAAAIAILHQQAGGPGISRVLSFGLPGALLVMAAVTGRAPRPGSWPTRTLIRLGDASYAMYLFHPFVMRGATLVSAHLGRRSETSGILTVLLSLIVAQLCALAINAWFERNVTALLRRRLVSDRIGA
jgi:peptidoglycan/LPS O-acetylase OafA/YrhL